MNPNLPFSFIIVLFHQFFSSMYIYLCPPIGSPPAEFIILGLETAVNEKTAVIACTLGKNGKNKINGKNLKYIFTMKLSRSSRILNFDGQQK